MKLAEHWFSTLSFLVAKSLSRNTLPPPVNVLAMISRTESWQWLIEGGSRVNRTFGGYFVYSRRFAEEPPGHMARMSSVQLAPTLVASSTAAARSTHCAGFSGRGLMSVMGQMCLAQTNEITLFA